jgi:hypothetical protein
MKIILTERQTLLLESNDDNWGCNLFEVNSEDRDWCQCSMNRIKSKYQKIREVLEYIANRMAEEPDLSKYVKHYSDTDPIFFDNIKNIENLAKKLKNCENTKDTIDDFLIKIKKKFLFVTKQDTKFIYSSLTKLNTNYSALSYLLTSFRRRKKLKNSSFDDIFKSYFIKPEGRDEAAESPFFNLIFNYLTESSVHHSESKKIIDDVLKTIRGTEEIGEKAEKEVYQWLSKKYGDNNVIKFSGDYSWADFLGVDLLLYIENEWIPVQIKNKVKDCTQNYGFCKNACIGKKDYRSKDKSEWEFIIYK